MSSIKKERERERERERETDRQTDRETLQSEQVRSMNWLSKKTTTISTRKGLQKFK